ELAHHLGPGTNAADVSDDERTLHRGGGSDDGELTHRPIAAALRGRGIAAAELYAGAKREMVEDRQLAAPEHAATARPWIARILTLKLPFHATLDMLGTDAMEILGVAVFRLTSPERFVELSAEGLVGILGKRRQLQHLPIVDVLTAKSAKQI